MVGHYNLFYRGNLDMAVNLSKSFAYQFSPLKALRLTNEKYENIETIVSDEAKYWMHLDKPSKALQQKLAKKLAMPKAVRSILFAESVRPRCVKHETGLVMIVQGIQPGKSSDYENVSSLRLWITSNGLVSISHGAIQAVQDLKKTMETLTEPTPMTCLTELLDHVLYYTEETTYLLDEALDKIETNLELTSEASQHIMLARQNIVSLRRYMIPQRDAFMTLAVKIAELSEPAAVTCKELADNMTRQVETLEMLRDRAAIIQDDVTNQLGEVSNRRMYLLTIIMLIFTPAFFVMGLFSMYLPIPGMNSPDTWWGVIGFIFVSSVGLTWLFKKKKWL